MTDLITKTLRQHRIEATGLEGIACRCDHEWHRDFAAHQAEAVREVLTSDDAIERASKAITQRAGGDTKVGEMVRWAIAALFGEDE